MSLNLIKIGVARVLVLGTAGPIGTIEVSLDSSWSKDLPSTEAPGFPEPAGPEIQKNRKIVLETYCLRPKNIVLWKTSHLQLCSISRRIYVKGYIIGSICTTNKKPYMIPQKSTFTIFEMADSVNFLYGGSILLKVEQNMGARNFVRQAFLDKKTQIY